MAAGRDLACKEGTWSRRDKNNRPQHTQVHGCRCWATFHLNLLCGITADAVAGLALLYPIEVRKESAHQQQCADPTWARIYSFWNTSKLHLQTRPSDQSALELQGPQRH